MPPSFNERDRRYAVRIAAEVGLGGRTLSVLTDNVSPHGLFVRTDVCGQLRQLVRIRLELPEPLGRIETHGMVVHRVPPGTVGASPGMGIMFYAMDAPRRARWNAFVDLVRERTPTTPSRAMVAHWIDAQPPEPIRRRFERFAAVLQVQVVMVDELVTMYTRDISRGGMLLRTDCVLREGDGLVLRIVHPRNRGTLSVPCEVRRVVREPDFLGAGVEFLDLDDGARAIFWEFIGAEIEHTDDGDVVLIDESELPDGGLPPRSS